MRKKFAFLQFVESIDDIPSATLMKKSPARIRRWYLNRSDPVIEAVELAGVGGINVKIPAIKSSVQENEPLITELMTKTLRLLYDMDVSIVLPPPGYPFEMPGVIPVATGRMLLPFFISEAVKKAFLTARKDIKSGEVIILDGNTDITLAVLDSIHAEVNMLTVITGNPDSAFLKEKAVEILGDSGLILNISQKNVRLLESADVVINTSSEDLGFDYYFKRGAVYFDLSLPTSDSRNSLLNLRRRREDMLISDSLGVNFADLALSLPVFEMLVYVKNRDYRRLFHSGFSSAPFAAVKDELKKTGAAITSFYINEAPIAPGHISKYLIKSGKVV